MSSSIKNARDASQDDRAAHTSGGESDTSGYETDTTLTVDGAVDDDDGDGDEALATFSSSKTIHESADVVRIAPFPAPPVIEEDEASPVDWAPALPPRDRWPADLADLFANNPSGLQTWTEVETAMQRLVSYHAVRDTTHLYLPWRAARDAPAHARTAHARTRARSTLLAGAARLPKSIRGNASPERMCISPYVAQGSDAVPKRRHRSPLGTKGLRPIVLVTGVGYPPLPTRDQTGHIRVAGLRPGMLYLDEVEFVKLT